MQINSKAAGTERSETKDCDFVWRNTMGGKDRKCVLPRAPSIKPKTEDRISRPPTLLPDVIGESCIDVYKLTCIAQGAMAIGESNEAIKAKCS